VASVMASDRFRLTVQGQNAHSVDSPARGRSGASAPPAQPAPNGESKSGEDRNDSGTVEGSASGGSGEDGVSTLARHLSLVAHRIISPTQIPHGVIE